MEIERRFLVSELPMDLEAYPVHHIEQAYLSRTPVIRIRQRNDEYFLTCKGKGLLSREEHELSLTAEEYQSLLQKAEGQIISKDRYCIPYNRYTIELDVFGGSLAPLVIAEVEFSTEDQALAFQPPMWFGTEVTCDPSYTNAALSAEEGSLTEIKPGRYRHFKGKEYEVLCMASHSETQQPMVVYRALYGKKGVWVRPVSMWNETVTREGKRSQRFTYIDDGESHKKD